MHKNIIFASKTKDWLAMKQPKRMPMNIIYRQFLNSDGQGPRMLMYHNDIGLVMGVNSFFVKKLTSMADLYLLEDYRMGRVVRGSIHAVINLQERTFTEGMVVFLTPGIIVEPLEVSADFQLNGLGMTPDCFLLAHGGRPPEIFNGQMREGMHQASTEECALLDQLLRTVLAVIGTEGIGEQVVYHAVATVTNFFNHLFTQQRAAQAPSHATDIFNRFIRLVNLHGRTEHQLAFYADHICITDRYLGTIIKQVSGIGAKEWIDRAIVAAAKVMLRHSDKNIAQIADELRFANSSFFCKYFKRNVGCTPQEYRRQA